MKKLFLSLLFILSLCNVCFANNRVSNIDVKVTIRDDGSANITQRWLGTFKEGTENYIPLENMDYTLTNFKVKQIILDEYGPEKDGEHEFTSLGNSWNIDASKDQKTNKCGIHPTGNKSLELCWGIGEYGYNIYELSYDVNPLAKSFTDLDGFNFQFINDGMNIGPTTGEVVIKFENPDITITQENTRAWGFGYIGEVEFWDNSLHFYTRQDLTANDSMICMVNFDKGMISPTTQIDKTFDEALKKEAFKGSDYKDTKPLNKFQSILFLIFSALVSICIIGLLIFLTIKGRNWFLGIFMIFWGGIPSISAVPLILMGGVVALLVLIFPLVAILILLFPALKQMKWDKKIPSEKNIDYWRDCPKNSELFKTYSCVHNNQTQLKIKVDNLIASMMMVMIQKGELGITKDISTGLLGNEIEKVNITFNKEPENANYRTLYLLLKMAAGSNNILEKNEIKTFGYKHSTEIESLLNVVSSEGIKEAQAENLGTFKDINTLTDKGVEFVSHLIGLKKYFKDFSLLNERDIEEVHNWNEMLVYATILDEAAKVMDRLKVMYPEAQEIQNSIWTSNVCSSFGSSLNSGVAKYKSEQARSSGSGGHSSHGGGGGHSGGGHGGGSR